MSESHGPTHEISPAEAAKILGLSDAVLRALVLGGYLTVQTGRLSAGELEAFQGLKEGAPTTSSQVQAAEPVLYQDLLEFLEAHLDDLAGKTYEAFAQSIPDARQWTQTQRDVFMKQARGRFDAILAIVDQDLKIEEALQVDLEKVGANAATNESSLPHILLVLRISRDLLIRTAIHLDAKHGGSWNTVVREFSDRLLPAIDRLTDTITSGFWTTKLNAAQHSLDRIENVVERMPFGVYEADVDGVITWTNSGLARLLHRFEPTLVGMRLHDVMNPIQGGGSLAGLFAEGDSGNHVSLVVAGLPEPISVEVDTIVRQDEHGSSIGFAGVVRLADAASPAEPAPATNGETVDIEKNVAELRHVISVLADGGKYMQEHSTQLSPQHVAKAGESLQAQAQHLLKLLSLLG